MTRAQAQAQAPATRFALGYSVPAVGCPSREAFVQAVSVRAPAAQEASSGEAALTLKVRLEGSANQAKGTLTVRRPDGLSSQRDVPEGPCMEVAESLAVIIAMLLDQREFEPAPRPSVAEGAQAVDAKQAADSHQVSSAQPGAEPAANERPRAVGQAPPARISPLSARAASPPITTRPAWGFALTLATLFESQASPSFALGLLAGVEGSWARDSLWSPSARLAAYQVDAGRKVTQGDVTFRLRALRMSACPLRWFAHARLAVHGCGVFDAGELRARGEFAGGKTLTMPWFAAGAGGRLALTILSFLDLEGEAVLQALSPHDEFVLEPNDFSVHSLAPVTLGASLGLTLRPF